MGNTSSKIDVESLTEFLRNDKLIEDDEFWRNLFRTPLTQDLVEQYFPISLIREARDAENPNFLALFLKILEAFHEVIELGHKEGLGVVGGDVARTCLFLLSRFIPAVLEVPTPFEEASSYSGSTRPKALYDFFWKINQSEGATLDSQVTDSPTKLPSAFPTTHEQEKEAKDKEDVKTQDKTYPVAIQILSALQRLLFLKNFTLNITGIVFPTNYVPPRFYINPQLLWKGGIGSSENVTHCKASVTIFRNRELVLNCLLVCLSSSVYRTQALLTLSVPSLWLWSFTHSSFDYMANFYCSLMSVIFYKTPLKVLGYNLTSGASFSNQSSLRSIAIKVMCVLVDFELYCQNVPPSPTPHDPPTNVLLPLEASAEEGNETHLVNADDTASVMRPFNLYKRMLQAMKEKSEMSLVFHHMCFLLGSSCGHLTPHRSSLPSKDTCLEEMLFLLWKLSTLNKTFLTFMTHSMDSKRLIVPLLCIALESSGILRTLMSSSQHEGHDASIHNGIVNLCSLIFFNLTSERQFSTQLNEPFQEKIPISFPVFSGCYGDFVVLALYQLIVRRMVFWANESLIDILLTSFCNISPYIKCLCSESCVKIVTLFQILSRPDWLFQQPYRYRNIFILLEAIDNLLQYQYEQNTQLVYSIIRRFNVFKQFDEISLTAYLESRTSESEAASHQVLQENDKMQSGPFSPLNQRDISGSKRVTWEASQEWFQKWKAQSPTQTVMSLIEHLLPIIQEACLDEEFPDQQTILTLLKKTTVVGILPVPPPILVRNYVSHASTDSWLTMLIWKVIVTKRPQTVYSDNLTLFALDQPV